MKEIVTDVAIVGAGSAGLSRSISGSLCGADVLVIDENSRPGGQLFKQIHKFFGSKEHQAGTRGFVIGQQLLEKGGKSGAKVMLDSLVYGLLPDKSMGVISNGRQLFSKSQKDHHCQRRQGKLHGISGQYPAGRHGCRCSPDDDHVNRVLPGERILMVGSGNVGLIVSLSAHAGRRRGGRHCRGRTGRSAAGGVHAGKIKKEQACRSMWGTPSNRYMEKEEVEGVEIAAVDEKWNMDPGQRGKRFRRGYRLVWQWA